MHPNKRGRKAMSNENGQSNVVPLKSEGAAKAPEAPPAAAPARKYVPGEKIDGDLLNELRNLYSRVLEAQKAHRVRSVTLEAFAAKVSKEYGVPDGYAIDLKERTFNAPKEKNKQEAVAAEAAPGESAKG